MLTQRKYYQQGQTGGFLRIVHNLVLLIRFFAFIHESESSSGFFWQLTDLHWDQQYSTDGNPTEMCHANSNIRSLSQRNLSASSNESSSGQFGMYTCDAPWDLIELSIKGMAENNANPDFIIWTGDNSPHVKDPQPDWPTVFSALHNISSRLKEYFPSTTIIPVLGNHDVFPGDLYPDESYNFYNAYLIKGGWSQLLTESAARTFSKCGFYTIPINVSIQVVVLNTNLYNPGDNLTHGEPDPCGQLAWLEQQLQLAEAKDIKVLLTAHIPPGYFERWITTALFTDDLNDRYVQLIHRYGTVLLTHVYGHTHTDSFRIFANSINETRSVAFISPSVTPWLHHGGVNPSLRLYEYSAAGIQDYQQYYANLTEISMLSRDQPAENPQWKLLYKATDVYNVSDLSNANMLKIYKDMLVNRSTFDLYYYHNTVGHVFEPCDDICVRDHMCAISMLTVSEMMLCQQGEHRLFKNDPQLSVLFEEIVVRNVRLPNSNHVSIVFMFLWLGMAVLIFLSAALVLIGFRSSRSSNSEYARINDSQV